MKRRILQVLATGLLSLFIVPSLGLSIAVAQENTFTVQQPDYQKSPYTGMTRHHWIQAGEYLLRGAFNYIHSLDDQMYFPKQLDKTYPKNEGQIPVAKLEGLARTLFVAAPLLKENPELEMNGVKVADYYRHQLIKYLQPEKQELYFTSPGRTESNASGTGLFGNFYESCTGCFVGPVDKSTERFPCRYHVELWRRTDYRF